MSEDKNTKVNGFQIQSALKLAKLVSEAAYANFTQNIMQFEGLAGKQDLDTLYAEYVSAETKVAKLQTLQDQYNVNVMVPVRGVETTLSEVINRIGGAGRAAKLWRLAMNGTQEVSRYSRMMSPDIVRDKDKEYAGRSKPQAHCMSKLQEAEKTASALREAISVGNTTIVNFSDDDGLFS